MENKLKEFLLSSPVSDIHIIQDVKPPRIDIYLENKKNVSIVFDQQWVEYLLDLSGGDEQGRFFIEYD